MGDLPLLTQPGSRLTRRRPSHHPAREEFGSWCEGCCGCERASACEKLKLVYQHLLGRLLLVKAAAKALCLIRQGLVIKGAPNHFFCRGPCLHEGKLQIHVYQRLRSRFMVTNGHGRDSGLLSGALRPTTRRTRCQTGLLA